MYNSYAAKLILYVTKTFNFLKHCLKTTTYSYACDVFQVNKHDIYKMAKTWSINIAKSEMNIGV